MPCTHDESPEEKEAAFQKRALYNSKASVLLCEACTLLEQNGQLINCSQDLIEWFKEHTKQDLLKLKLAFNSASSKGMDELIKFINSLDQRDKDILGIK